MYQRILVAVDLSEQASIALVEARALKSSTGATLAMVHVLPEFSDLKALEASGYAETLPAMTEWMQTVRRKIHGWAAVAESDPEVELFVEQGSAASRIVERAESWNADLVVVGSHSQTGVARALLGSVAQRVVHNASCPVLVSRPGPRSGAVLAATDLSDPSLPAITRAAAEAHRRGSRLTVVHVVDQSAAMYAASAGGLFGLSIALPPPELRAEVKEAMTQTMKNALHRLGATGEVLVLYGKPADGIVKCAEEIGAGLIVVGTHGRTGLVRMAMGSVADAVIRNASCSVLVARHKES